MDKTNILTPINMKKVSFMLLAFIFCSCGDSKEELYDEISDLQNQVSELQEQISERDERIEELEERLSNIQTYASEAQYAIDNLRVFGNSYDEMDNVEDAVQVIRLDADY